MEGEVDGDEEVEQLDSKQEKVLRSAQKQRAGGNAKKDERQVDKLLETFFDIEAAVQSVAWWMTVTGLPLKGTQHRPLHRQPCFLRLDVGAQPDAVAAAQAAVQCPVRGG